MYTMWVRIVLYAMTMMLTFEPPAPAVTKPERTVLEEARMWRQMEKTTDIRRCISLGAELELDRIDLRRFEMMPEDMDVLYHQMLGSSALPWYMDLRWSYEIARDETVSYLKPAYLDPVQYDRGRYERAAEEALAEAVKPGMSELQIALSLHDYLAVRCAYDNTLQRSTDYDALVRGNAVCQGYAEAYMDLLERAGIESIVVTSEQMNHAWNQVKLDGQWYNVDLTWNDPTPNHAGQVSHSFFLISDETMGSADYGYYGWTSTNECTDTTYESGQFWSESISPILYTDADTCYLIRVGESSYQILRRDAQTGAETRLARMDFKYPEAFAKGSRWTHFYTTGLSKVGDALYYTDVNGVRRLDLSSGQVTTVYEHDVSETRTVLVGSFFDGRTLHLTTMDRNQGVNTAEIPFDAQ